VPFDPLCNSGCSAEPVVTLSGDEMKVVEGDQGGGSSESKEVKGAANDAGFWISFVEEGWFAYYCCATIGHRHYRCGTGGTGDRMERFHPFVVNFSEGPRSRETR
jgi:hypothetical protein